MSEEKNKMIERRRDPEGREDEMKEEERREKKRVHERRERRDFREREKVLMEELVPRETGREARIEKRKAKGAYLRREEGSEFDMDEKQLMGGDDRDNFRRVVDERKMNKCIIFSRTFRRRVQCLVCKCAGCQEYCSLELACELCQKGLAFVMAL